MAILALVFVLKPPYPHANAQTGSLTKREEAKVAVVSAPVANPAPTPTAPPPAEPVVATPQPPPVVGVTNCGDNPYKQFIYQHESGCRTDAVNSIGCTGLGQACPGSKLPCSLSDWVCQDNWFSNYAIQRYGSWEAAYNFWQANRWW